MGPIYIPRVLCLSPQKALTSSSPKNTNLSMAATHRFPVPTLPNWSQFWPVRSSAQCLHHASCNPPLAYQARHLSCWAGAYSKFRQGRLVEVANAPRLATIRVDTCPMISPSAIASGFLTHSASPCSNAGPPYRWVCFKTFSFPTSLSTWPASANTSLYANSTVFALTAKETVPNRLRCNGRPGHLLHQRWA